MGAQSGDDVRDPQIILDWFLHEVPFPLDIARQKCTEWRFTELSLNEGLSIADLRALRGIKNRLTLIASLAEQGMLPLGSECWHWLPLREELP